MFSLVFVLACADSKPGVPGETADTAPLPPAPRWSGSGELSLRAARTWLGEGPGDRLGRTVAAGGDLNGDGTGDLLLGAYYQTEDLSRNGKIYAFFGPLFAGEAALSDADWTAVGEAETAFVSRAMAGVGDLNGDGIDDLAVGAPNDPVGIGQVGLFAGGSLGGDHVLSEADVRLSGETGLAGAMLLGPGDLDGDGLADLLVSAIFEESGGVGAGATYALPGPVLADQLLADVAARRIGAEEDNAGWFLSAAGDVDGDGRADVWAGAPGADAAATDAGAAYLLLGPISDGIETFASAAALTLLGAGEGHRAGSSVAGGSDLDGDGAADVAVGEPGADAATGAVAVALGPLGTGTLDLSAAWARWTGSAARVQAGWGLALPGDLDRDGFGELWIGSFGGDELLPGEAALVYGPPAAGTHTLTEADASFSGGEDGDYAGWFLSGAGDVDSDGLPDLVVGAQRSDAAGEEAGRVHLLLAPEG